MKIFALILFFVGSLCSHAADFDARAAFGVSPGHDLDVAMKRAVRDKKPVFLAFWDSKKKGNAGLEMIYDFGLEETKKLLKENFILVLLDREHKSVQKYMPAGNTEGAQYVIISPDGKLLKSGAFYGNSGVGLKGMKEFLNLP